jgi:hypothetical protein
MDLRSCVRSMGNTSRHRAWSIGHRVIWDLGLRISDFISQQMTAQRSDLMTAKPYDVKLDLSEALFTSPLCLVP